MRADRRKKRVALSGYPVFAQSIGQLAATHTDWEPLVLEYRSRLEQVRALLTILRCDVWYSIGGPPDEGWIARIVRVLRKPRVVHWVGTDVSLVEADFDKVKPWLGGRMLHLAETVWMAQPLQEKGLNPRIAPLPPRVLPRSSATLPEQFTVMLYVPRHRSRAYAVNDYESLMSDLGDLPVRYLIVGGGELNAPAGVTAVNLGWQRSLERWYRETTVLVRLLQQRDGLSLMVLEALAFARYVIWSQPFDLAEYAGDWRDAARAVRTLHGKHAAGTLVPNAEGARVVHERYGPRAAILSIARAWSDSRTAQAGPNRDPGVPGPNDPPKADEEPKQ